ncbi:MAG: AraC family transcriptional regulator [Clostridia bacterium]|nr:AraC family transcriptional regulator [Clostridia bacterium]
MKKIRYSGKEELTVCYCEEEVNLKPGARFGPVIRDIYIIECCTEGYGSVIVNGREFPVTPGSCYVLLPGDTVIHTADTVCPRKGMWCSVDGLAMGRLLSLAGITSSAPFAPPELFQELCAWVKRMVSVWRSDSAGAPLILTSCIYGFLGTLLRDRQSPAAAEEWVERALGLMESRYHEPLSVEEIAGEIGLERAYFSTVFKEKTGLSPHRYLTSLRVRKACGLLSDPAQSVSQVAALVGLDPRNFARIFKKETGKTPLAYRKER